MFFIKRKKYYRQRRRINFLAIYINLINMVNAFTNHEKDFILL